MIGILAKRVAAELLRCRNLRFWCRRRGGGAALQAATFAKPATAMRICAGSVMVAVAVSFVAGAESNLKKWGEVIAAIHTVVHTDLRCEGAMHALCFLCTLPEECAAFVRRPDFVQVQCILGIGRAADQVHAAFALAANVALIRYKAEVTPEVEPAGRQWVRRG